MAVMTGILQRVYLILAWWLAWIGACISEQPGIRMPGPPHDVEISDIFLGQQRCACDSQGMSLDIAIPLGEIGVSPPDFCRPVAESVLPDRLCGVPDQFLLGIEALGCPDVAKHALCFSIAVR